MNWSTKIVMGLGTFMIFIVGSVIFMVTKDTDSLVEDDYYEKSLSYDEVYDRKKNRIADHAQSVLTLENDTLTITFAANDNKGVLSFKRPSDRSLDKEVLFFTRSDSYKIPVDTLAKGNWSVEILWENRNRAYFDSQSLYIR